jgi:hypothetical protein
VAAENTGANVVESAGAPGSTIVPEESAVKANVTVLPPFEKVAAGPRSVHDPLRYL